MTTHEEVLLDLPAHLGNELPEARALAVEAHLHECDDCRAVFQELTEAAELARALPLEFRPPRRLEEKTFALIEMEREKEQRAAERGVAPQPTRIGRATETARRRWFSPQALLAPGLAALFIGLAVVAGSLWAQKTDLQQQLEQAKVDGGTSVADVELTAGSNTSATATASLIDLDGDNFRIVLNTNELPPPPKDYHYELWLGTGEDRWASAGTFATAGAEETYEFMTAVDPTEFTLLDITLEREDGQPDRGGQEVMRGQLDISEIGV